MAQELCPNCRTRFPDMPTEYDELLYSVFSSQSAGRWGRRSRSYRGESQYGKITLCALCAARYQRMVRLRTVGWKIANPAFGVLVLGALLFAYIVAAHPELRGGVGVYLVALPIFGAVVGLAIGCSLALAARLMRPSATRFLKGAS